MHNSGVAVTIRAELLSSIPHWLDGLGQFRRPFVGDLIHWLVGVQGVVVIIALEVCESVYSLGFVLDFGLIDVVEGRFGVGQFNAGGGLESVFATAAFRLESTSFKFFLLQTAPVRAGTFIG